MRDITVDQWYTLDTRQQEVKKRIKDGSLSIENALAGTQGVLDGIYPTPPIHSLPSWYVQPSQQIECVKEFLANYGGNNGFTPADIPSVPTNFVPRTSTEVLMLAVYLPNSRTKGITRTFESWWDFVKTPTGYSKWRWDQLKGDSKHLRLLPGIEHRPVIRWVAFDPNANHGKSPRSCWDNPGVAPTLAGPEVLMALAHFPMWAASWNGNKSPYPNMAGYQFYWDAAWGRCPYVNRLDDGRRLGLRALSAGHAGDRWASPSVREC